MSSISRGGWILVPAGLAAFIVEGAAAWLGGDRSLLTTMIDYPPFYQTIVHPCLGVLPVLTLVLFGAAGLALLRLLARGQAPARDLTLVLTWAGLLGVAITRPGSVSTRYTFAFYPLLLLLALEVACRAARLLPWTRLHPHVVGAGAILAAFLVSTDFQPGHLGAPAAESANFRTGALRRFSSHRYQRADFRGVAEQAALSLGGADGILILDRRTLPVARYFDRARTRVYLDVGHDLARSIPGMGWREMWTDLPVAYAQDGLADLLARAAGGPMLFAMHMDDRDRLVLEDPASKVGSAWTFELLGVERSGAIGLFRLSRRPAGTLLPPPPGA